MKKTIVMGLFVMSLTLTGCFNKDQASAPAENVAPEATPAQNQTADETLNLSLSEWLARGEDVKCTVYAPAGQTDTWVSGNKVRIDGLGFDQNQPGEIGHLLSDGEWVYTWSGYTGLKFNAAEIANQAQGGASSSQSADWKKTVADWENSGVEYTCEKAVIAEETFIAPEAVVFSEMGALLNVASSTTEGLMNNIPGNTEDVEAALEAAGITPNADMPIDDASGSVPPTE